MPFLFNRHKAIQAAALLLKRERCRRTNYMRLLKLLYIADRESLRDTGRPITGDAVYAMERGPVLSNILDLIKGSHISAAEWDSYIQRSGGYDVELITDPGVGSLSRYEVRKLNEVSDGHVNDDEWTLVKHTHEFAEWLKNKPPQGSSRRISPEDIIDAVGRSADAESILDEARRACEADRIFFERQNETRRHADHNAAGV